MQYVAFCVYDTSLGCYSPPMKLSSIAFKLKGAARGGTLVGVFDKDVGATGSCAVVRSLCISIEERSDCEKSASSLRINHE